MKKESEYSIIVKDVHKRFKLVYDKPFTLKERLLFWKNTKVGYHNVLQGINLKILTGMFFLRVKNCQTMSRLQLPKKKLISMKRNKRNLKNS